MNRVLIKSTILVCFIVIMGYQMLNIWSQYYKVNLFTQDESETVEMADHYLLIADSVELFFEDGNIFSIGRIPKDYDLIYDKSIVIVAQIMQNGYIYDEFDPKAVVEDERVVYNLRVPLSLEEFSGEFGVEIVKINMLDKVEAIGISHVKDQVIVYLVDYTHEKAVCFVSKGNLIYNSYEEVMDLKEGLMTKNYATYDLINQQSVLEKGLLVPLANDNLIYDSELLFITPFVKEQSLDKEINEKAIGEYVNQYFANPAVKWQEKSDDGRVIEFGDDEIIIKYRSDGVFEYNKIVKEGKGDLSISDSYNVCEEFLKNDKSLIDLERILEDYAVNGNETTFYYSYKYSDYPVIMNGGDIEEKMLVYPMEVTVESGVVKKYKRILLQREDFMPQKFKFSSDYKVVLTRFTEEYGIDRSLVTDMYLAYYEENNVLGMKWIIGVENTLYVYEVY